MKRLLVETWAFVAVAVIAFAGGLLIGDLAASPKTETVSVSSSEGEEGGAQVFTSASCGSCHTLAAAGSTGQTGPNLDEFLAPDDNTEAVEEMIVDPNAELAEGYPANVMPADYGQTLSSAEVQQLSEYLVATTPANP